MERVFDRYSDIISQEKLNKYRIHIIGTGAIGSQAALMLYKMGHNNLVLWDDDVVSETNIGIQGFPYHSISQPKVEVMKSIFDYYHPREHNIEFRQEKFKGSVFNQDYEGDILFICVDSMQARKTIVNPTRYSLAIDARMGAEMITMLIFGISQKQQHKDTLIDNNQTYQARCTAKSTLYTASVAAAFMVAEYKYWLVMEQEELDYSNVYYWTVAGGTSKLTFLQMYEMLTA